MRPVRQKSAYIIERKLEIGLVLNTGFTVLEIVVGIASGSLALLADAAHNLTDSISMVVSFIAQRVAERPANERKTYGYGRIKIVAATLNSLFLLIAAGYVLLQAWHRFNEPHLVSGSAIASVASVGIVINVTIAAMLFRNRGDLNMRSLYVNMALDAVALVGTLIAGILVTITGNTIFDPLISVLIGGMLIITAWQILWESLKVFLEAVPSEVNFFTVEQAIKAMSFVNGVDDLHIWTITSDELSMSCHVQLRANTHVERAAERVDEIETMLARKFKIKHATIKVEAEPCEAHEVHHPDLTPPEETKE